MISARELSLLNYETRHAFLFGTCLVLHYGQHDGIKVPDVKEGLALYPYVRRIMLRQYPHTERKHKNATKRVMRALNDMKSGLAEKIADRAMMLGGFTPRWWDVP